MRAFLILILIVAFICFLSDQSGCLRIEKIEQKDEFGYLRSISYKPTLNMNKLFIYLGSLPTHLRRSLFGFFEK
jgi:hypothetical protein